MLTSGTDSFTQLQEVIQAYLYIVIQKNKQIKLNVKIQESEGFEDDDDQHLNYS